MSSPTRFPKGVTNAEKENPLGNIGQLDPTKFITFFEDFCNTGAFPLATTGLGAADTANWDIDVTEAGAGNASSAIADMAGGGIVLTNDAADNDVIAVQHKCEAFRPSATKKAAFKARFKVSDATQSDFIIGMYVRDTTPLGAVDGDGVTDGIFFQKDDGDANLDVYCQKDTTTGQLAASAIATLSNDTFLTVGWYYDGRGTLHVYVNDVLVEKMDVSAYLPDTEIAIGFAIQNGEAVAKSMTIDYVLGVQER